MVQIRKVIKSDLADLKEVLNTIELFPAEMLEDMISNYFNHPETADIWFTATQDEKPIAIGFCAPEKMTEGTYNLYAIGIKKDLQGQGIGGAMMTYIEDDLKSKGHRILLVETSGSADFELTRAFYLKKGYTKEATIRDFWQAGEDKVIFWKKL